jgi:geranylgeranyl diphosphate synthase type I
MRELDSLRSWVDDALGEFLGARIAEVEGLHETAGVRRQSAEREFLSPIVDLVSRGGKRLRAALCVLGWAGAGRLVDGDEGAAIVRAGASLELLHACALIHDDVMDRSATRRGGPTVHRVFEARHAEAGWRGDAEQFGVGAAVAAGDLCLVFADQLFRESGLSTAALDRGRPIYDAMRAETIHGQYLDLVAQARGSLDLDEALAVAGAKTAACTTVGPLCFGAALAGAGDELLAAYQAYGSALGLAFQLRDDLLGAFADPEQTGKPSGDDLRDGKCTVLLAEAYQRSDEIGRARLRLLVGRGTADTVGELRGLLERSGARDAVEERIRLLGKQALEALSSAPLPRGAGVHEWLAGLVATVTNG